MIARRFLALTLALFGLAAGWAAALPETATGSAPARIEVIDTSDVFSDIPEGAILVFNDDGILDSVLRDQHSVELAQGTTALHPLSAD